MPTNPTIHVTLDFTHAIQTPGLCIRNYQCAPRFRDQDTTIEDALLELLEREHLCRAWNAILDP
jgi:hypothetical protein